jgi:hypothetical protein
MIALKCLFFMVWGFLGVGIPTLRTLHVIDGNYLKVFPLSIFASVNMYLFTYLVANQDYLFMIFNSIGAAFSVSYLAYKRYKDDKRREQTVTISKT